MAMILPTPNNIQIARATKNQEIPNLADLQLRKELRMNKPTQIIIDIGK